MHFTIIVSTSLKRFQMQVKRVYQSEQVERYEISAGGKTITVRNNRPFVKNKRKKPDWKLEEGEVSDKQSLAMTLFEIEKYLDVND